MAKDFLPFAEIKTYELYDAKRMRLVRCGGGPYTSAMTAAECAKANFYFEASRCPNLRFQPSGTVRRYVIKK